MRLRNSHPKSKTCKRVSTEHTASHIMYLYYLWHLLLLATYCTSTQVANKVDYLPLGALGAAAEADTSRMTIALPEGFKPEAPPIRPMLLPFATPASSNPSNGWRPIVGDAVTQQLSTVVTAPMPLAPPPTLQDRIDLESHEQNVEQQEGPLLESIVYGTWKPERPLGPDEIQKPTLPPVAAPTAVYSRKRPTDSIERLGVEHPIAGVQTAGALLNQKYERKRILTTHARHPAVTFPPNKYINLNSMSDQNILEMFKQINNSNGEISTHTHSQKKHTWYQETTEISLDIGSKNESENEAKTESESETETEMPEDDVSKVWPIDFIASLERNHRQKLTQKTLNYSFVGDSSEPPQALNGLNIPNSLLPTFNITKVGVPYEKQNPAEGPALCVPLTVLEQLGEGDVMEIERVYCFPLPPAHKEIPVSDTTTTKARVVDYTGYEAVNATGCRSLSCYIKILCLTLSIMSFLKLKFS